MFAFHSVSRQMTWYGRCLGTGNKHAVHVQHVHLEYPTDVAESDARASRCISSFSSVDV